LRNIPGIETGTPSSLSVQKDNLWNTYLNYEHLIGNTLNFKTNFNYQDNLIHYENLPFIKSFYKNVTLSNNSQFIFKKASETILGYDLTYGVLNSNEVENNPERLQLGIYTVSNLKLLSNKTLLLFPSLRYDYFSDSKISNLSARLGLNYNVLGKGFIYLKSNIGNNFRAPTFNELYWNPGGNKNLLQEKSFSIDLGFIMNYNFIFSNIFEFNYIYNNITNKIVWIPNPTGFWSPDNIGNTEIKNLNFELKLFKQLTTRIKFSTISHLIFAKV
jgi:outer membrane cobalamin receptor